MPNRSWPDGTRPCHARPNLNAPRRIYSPKRAAEEAEASCAAVCNCWPATPCIAVPDHAGPHQNSHCPTQASLTVTTPLREQQRSPKAPVLPSATIASPRPTAPVRSLPIQAMPSLPSKESSREDQSPQCCRLQLSPHLTAPDRTAPQHALPSWDLHQGMPSMIRLLQRAYG